MDIKIGQDVFYCFKNRCGTVVSRPAKIVHSWNTGAPYCVQLAVFVDGTNDVLDTVAPVVWRTSVTYSEEPIEGRWHL